jgi:Fe-S oxidoreductase
VSIPLHLAKETDLRTLGVESVDQAERSMRLLEFLGEYRRFARSLSVMLESCTNCGACTQACHSYLGTNDFYNIPAARAGILRRIYTRRFTWLGRILGRIAGAEEPDTAAIERLVTYAYQCNLCRRCALYCPFGIDTAEVMSVARNILTRLGIAPRFMVDIGKNELADGNNMGIHKPALLDSCSFLEDELREETGIDIRIPVDKPDSDILYVPSSTEFFTNVETTMGAAKLFHVLGINWTLSSTLVEAANYGLHFNLHLMKEHNRRLRIAASEVGAGVILQGECGHGWRAAKMYSEGANGPLPVRLVHILDFLAENLSNLNIKKLSLRATLHDPCNYARSGDIVDTPRTILRACVEEFVEMSPNRERNFCCGGGSGLLMEEMFDIRMQLGKMKAEQVRALLPLDYLALPCASCKAQVPLVLKHYGMGEVRTGGIVELLSRAMVMG